MTDLDLDAIEARANAATPGPWIASGDEVLLADSDWVATVWGRTNPVFIAHARTDMPALIAEVRRLRQVAEEP